MLHHDTWQICSDALYRGQLGPALNPEALFWEFMHLATEGVVLIMCAQIDGGLEEQSPRSSSD